jgi:hypothetical protein
MEVQNNMKIYLINNKKVKSKPPGAEIIPTKIKTHQFPSDSIVTKVNSHRDGETWLRCWITNRNNDRIILENVWRDKCLWFITHETGGYTLDKWHSLLEEFRPIENWCYELQETYKKQMLTKEMCLT